MKDYEPNEIFVKINQDAIKKLAKLAHPHQIEPDLLLKIINHALVCDKWKLDPKKALV